MMENSQLSDLKVPSHLILEEDFRIRLSSRGRVSIQTKVAGVPLSTFIYAARNLRSGDFQVKPVAALAMIDEEELDWKIVVISLDDPRASLVNDVADEKHFPGTLTAIRGWFRDYKILDGKPANKFGLGNKVASKDYALKVIAETNEAWAKLVRGSIPSGELSLV